MEAKLDALLKQLNPDNAVKLIGELEIKYPKK